jgi:hypothetical protein
MDNNSELINYIVQELKRGVPEQSIRTALLQSGWAPGPVDRAFIMLRQGDLSTPQTTAGAELPTVSGANAASYTQVTSEKPVVLPIQSKQKTTHWPLIIVLCMLLGAGSIAAFYFSRQDTAPKVTNYDTTRKISLDTLADKLATYYAAKNTYPTRNKINDARFANTSKGFNTNQFRDPKWNNKNTGCAQEGRAIFTELRSAGCVAYRVTAANGDDCDETKIKCTRVVLTATLQSGKPYIVALDHNKKER